MGDITNEFVKVARSKGVTVYTRRQWGSTSLATYQWRRRYRKHTLIPNQPVDTLWQHITVTKDTGRGPKQFKADMRTLERIGNERFGTGVSYSLVIDAQTGEVGIGQPFDAAGAHTLNDKKIPGYSFNQNYVSLAISVLGMPGAKLSQKAGDALVLVIQSLIEIGVLTRTFDYEPHRLVAWKDCPTDNIVNVMPAIRRTALKKESVVAEPVASTEEVSVELKKPAVEALRKVRDASTGKTRRKINAFLRWLRTL